MKRLLSILTMVCLASMMTFAQTHEVGIGAGTSNFLGDLGKKNPTARFYFGDIEASLFRPSFSVFYRYTMNPWFAIRGGLTYAQFEGDDKLAGSQEFMDDAWFRNYRNLHFKSHSVEAAVTGEVHFMKYQPGSMKHRFAPYFTAGIALLMNDPRAKYEGEWVRLRPLGTEGQGMPGYGEKYSMVHPTIPLGIGFKFNATSYLSVGIEFGHRVTFTDYLDDVSGVYADPDDFRSYYGTERGDMVIALANRSVEIDPEGQYQEITQPGEYRGNPFGNDAYLVSQFTITYNINHKQAGNYNPYVSKRQLKKYRKAFK